LFLLFVVVVVVWLLLSPANSARLICLPLSTNHKKRPRNDGTKYPYVYRRIHNRV
jgi:hypothetical protein